MIRIRNNHYWTAEHYKDEPFKPIIEFDSRIAGQKPFSKKDLRAFTKENLSLIKNKDIVNKGTKIIAKMSSDKAINKSLKNGFTLQEHFKAVNDIEALFINAKFLRSEKAKNASKDLVAVHRFINENALENKARALITLKESYQNGNRIYSLELAELQPTAFLSNPSP